MKFIRKQKQAHTKSSFTQRLNNISRWNYLSLTQSRRERKAYIAVACMCHPDGAASDSHAASVFSASLREKKCGICAKQKIRVQ